ncbi:MAG: hypothetical protein K2K74_14680 [Lachnospiraceae bacterium]|nr:hypothetical protein [Lachnospiraceae bacterium]
MTKTSCPKGINIGVEKASASAPILFYNSSVRRNRLLELMVKSQAVGGMEEV